MGQLKIVCAQLGPIDTNTYILMDDEIKEAIIIDPAGSPEELIKFLEDEGYSLDGVLLTHGHHDHIGALEGLREHYDPWKLRVYAAKPEQEVLMVKDYNLSTMFGEGYTTHANMMIDDKQIFEVTSKHKCQCLYTPGHTLEAAVTILQKKAGFSLVILFLQEVLEEVIFLPEMHRRF